MIEEILSKMSFQVVKWGSIFFCNTVSEMHTLFEINISTFSCSLGVLHQWVKPPNSAVKAYPTQR